MGVPVTQGVDTWLLFRLTKAGAGVTGLVYGDVTCKFLRASDSAFAAKVLSSGNFREKSDGYYEILFAGDTNLDVEGRFEALIEGADIDACPVTAIVKAAAEADDAYSIDVCTISGRIVGADGQPLAGATVWWRKLASSLSLGALVAGDSRAVKSRQDGTFSFDVPRNLRIVIDCPVADFSRIVTVPNQASVLLTEIP